MPRISAIIVTHNNREDVSRCLASLRASSPLVDEVIVVDHDSTDGTPDWVMREFPNARLLRFLDNPGFGEGNNRGARVASGEYLLMLNPDATVDRACIERLVSVLENDQRLGIAVPKVVLASEPSVLNSAGLCVNSIGHAWDRGYLEWDAGQYDRSEAVLAGSGCVLLVRATLFLALGGFDASYFLYYEDLDLCWRSWMMGSQVRYVPAAVARHAMKVSARPAVYDHYFDHRNRLRTVLKNMSWGSLMRVAWPLLSFEAGSALLLARRRQWRAIWLRARALAWNVARLPDTLRHRRVSQSQRTLADEALARFFTPGHQPRLGAALPGYPEAYEDQLDARRLSSDLTMGSNDVGALGLGWYELESFQGLPSRWCCGYGIAFLKSPAQGGRATLKIRCSAMRRIEVTLRTDRQDRGRFVVNPDTWQEIETTVPLAGSITRLELIVAPTFAPEEIDSALGDRRPLGIAVGRLMLSAS